MSDDERPKPPPSQLGKLLVTQAERQIDTHLQVKAMEVVFGATLHYLCRRDPDLYSFLQDSTASLPPGEEGSPEARLRAAISRLVAIAGGNVPSR